MKLPVIKNLIGFIETNDEDYVIEAIEVIEHLAQAKGLKENELEVIGELLSNMFGALEVHKEIKTGTNQKDALNGFMKRVLGSIN
jgi:hypothetical protein